MGKDVTIFIKKLQQLAIVAAVLTVVVLGVWLFRSLSDSHVEMGADEEIDLSPTQIQSIKAIGEWEFLSVSTEELIDTVRKGLFSDDELARIYYGTLRLGVNLHQVEPGWIETSGDSVRITLPKVGPLDSEFIDEARTKSFFESGSWKPQDREAMYRRAHERMLRHALTKENLQAAEENARLQVEQMMKAMGYKNVEIRFSD